MSQPTKSRISCENVLQWSHSYKLFLIKTSYCAILVNNEVLSTHLKNEKISFEIENLTYCMICLYLNFKLEKLEPEDLYYVWRLWLTQTNKEQTEHC